MTSREIALLERINQSGIDNTMWGIVREDGLLTGELHGADQNIVVPAHIYIHREDSCVAVGDPVVQPSATIYREDGDTIDLYFIDREAVAG